MFQLLSSIESMELLNAEHLREQVRVLQSHLYTSLHVALHLVNLILDHCVATTYRLHFCKPLKSVIGWYFVECPDFQRIIIMTAVCRNIHSNFQGVIVTLLVGLI